MNILVIHNEYVFKGGEDSVVELEVEMLISQGHNVFKLLASNKNIRNIISERKDFYINLHKILFDNEIHIAHIHNVFHIIGSGIYQVLKDKNIPIVQTLHNFRFLCPSGLFLDNSYKICELCKKGDFKSSVLKKCYQKSYIKSFFMQELVQSGRKKIQKCVTLFIPLNTFYKNKYVEAGFKEDKLVVKPNFLFEKSKIKFSSSGNYALFIGRLSPEKGLETLIEAFKNIPYHLKIVGTGLESYMFELKSLAEGFKNIEFCGFASGEDKEELFRRASFIILPSIWYENFPMSVIEAYSYGKPIIASSVGGLPEIVIDNDTGLLVEPGNVDALTCAVNSIITENKFEYFGKRANAFFLNHFTDTQNYKQLIDIYDKAIYLNK